MHNLTAPNMADPEDCTQFYVCEPINRLTRMSCPDGLYYNPLIYTCDWSWNTIEKGTLCCNLPVVNRGKKKTQFDIII